MLAGDPESGVSSPGVDRAQPLGDSMEKDERLAKGLEAREANQEPKGGAPRPSSVSRCLK